MTECGEGTNRLSWPGRGACEQSGPRGQAWRPGPFAERSEVML
jgi:hypothetical protein